MIEKKVTWSTFGAFSIGLVTAGLNALRDDPGVLAPLPQWAQWLILTLAPALVAFAGGWAAPHTERSLPGTHRG